MGEKISAMTTAAAQDGTELLELSQTQTGVRTTVSQQLNQLLAGGLMTPLLDPVVGILENFVIAYAVLSATNFPPSSAGNAYQWGVSLLEGFYLSTGSAWELYISTPRTNFFAWPLVRLAEGLSLTLSAGVDTVHPGSEVAYPIPGQGFFNALPNHDFTANVMIPAQTTTGSGAAIPVFQYSADNGATWVDFPGAGSFGIPLGAPQSQLAGNLYNTPTALSSDFLLITNNVYVRLVYRGSTGTDAGAFTSVTAADICFF